MPMRVLERLLAPLIRAIDSDYFAEGSEKVREMPERFEFSRALPFIFLHLGCCLLYTSDAADEGAWTGCGAFPSSRSMSAAWE